MKNNTCRKMLVIGIIILFIGTSAVSSISGNFEVLKATSDQNKLISNFEENKNIERSLPFADAGGPYYETVGIAIEFNGTGSYDNDEEGFCIVQYDWKFYDGDSWHNNIGPTPSQQYDSEGSYIVTLRVHNNEGEIDTDTASAEIKSGEIWQWVEGQEYLIDWQSTDLHYYNGYWYITYLDGYVQKRDINWNLIWEKDINYADDLFYYNGYWYIVYGNKVRKWSIDFDNFIEEWNIDSGGIGICGYSIERKDPYWYIEGVYYEPFTGDVKVWKYNNDFQLLDIYDLKNYNGEDIYFCDNHDSLEWDGITWYYSRAAIVYEYDADFNYKNSVHHISYKRRWDRGFTISGPGDFWTISTSPNWAFEWEVATGTLPIVITNDSVEQDFSGTTLHGFLEDDGGEPCLFRFEYDINPGVFGNATKWYGWASTRYTYCSPEPTFEATIMGLSPGTLYYYRAQCRNGMGIEYGDERIFLSKPAPPASFGHVNYTPNSINLSWEKGLGADKTIIRYNTSGYPSDIDEGIECYNDTDTSCVVNDLESCQTYYFSAWSYTTESDLTEWSYNHSQHNCTTNLPPFPPSDPDPSDNATNVSINAVLNWSSGDPCYNDTVTYDVYFGDISPPSQVAWNVTETTYDPGTLDDETTYYWQIIAWDNHGASTPGPIWSFATEGINDPPTAPDIDGPTSGSVGTEYDYTFVSNDPEEDDIYYYIDWGDNTNTGWIGLYNSGEEIPRSHTWNMESTYTIRAKAKDIHGAIGEWGTLEVEMPVDHHDVNLLFFQFLERFVERFPLLERILELHSYFNRI